MDDQTKKQIQHWAYDVSFLGEIEPEFSAEEKKYMDLCCDELCLLKAELEDLDWLYNTPTRQEATIRLVYAWLA